MERLGRQYCLLYSSFYISSLSDSKPPTLKSIQQGMWSVMVFIPSDPQRFRRWSNEGCFQWAIRSHLHCQVANMMLHRWGPPDIIFLLWIIYILLVTMLRVAGKILSYNTSMKQNSRKPNKGEGCYKMLICISQACFECMTVYLFEGWPMGSFVLILWQYLELRDIVGSCISAYINIYIYRGVVVVSYCVLDRQVTISNCTAQLSKWNRISFGQIYSG